ncbi:MAG: FkbM family methyltransferase [Gammaproteobacteria bacterium]
MNRTRLAEHLRLNGAPRQVNVHERAVSDHAGAATLYHPNTPGRNHGQASLFAPTGATFEKFTVPTERLDQAINHSPRLIKMDIEGAELEAIKGMTGLLQNDAPPLLVIEHNPETCATAGYAPGDLLRELRRSNPHYQAHWIGWRLKPLDSADIIDAITLQGNILYRAANTGYSRDSNSTTQHHGLPKDKPEGSSAPNSYSR